MNYPKIYCLKTTNDHYLTESVGQEFESSLVEWPWIVVPYNLADQLSAKDGVIWMLSRGWRFTFELTCVTVSLGNLSLFDCWLEASVPHQVSLSP